MQIFISWSGDRSRRTAEVISRWLKQVIQAVDPWMSTEIEKGKRWGSEIAHQLEKSKAGIICLNKDNIDEKWILFEAGALSKMVKESYVCTFLLDFGPEEIQFPLADFQHTKFEKEDMRKLVQTLNSALSDSSERQLEENLLNDSFETYWPKLQKELDAIISEKPKKGEPARTQKEILAEILEIVRRIDRQDYQTSDLVNLLANLAVVSKEDVWKNWIEDANPYSKKGHGLGLREYHRILKGQESKKDPKKDDEA